MEKKIGRPPKGKSNLSHNVKVRVDDETYESLCQYCEMTGMERAEVIRQGLQEFLEKAREQE